MLPDGTLKFSHSLRFGDVEAIWKVDPLFPSDIKVDMKVRLSTNGSVSHRHPYDYRLRREQYIMGDDSG